MKKISLTILLLSFLNLSGCTTAPSHHSLQNVELPTLIPLREFIANTSTNFGYQLSPDGKMIAWLAVKGTRMTIHFREIHSQEVQIIDSHSKRDIFHFNWAQDSKTMFFSRDNHGDENYQIYSVNIEQADAQPVNVTNFNGGVRAAIVAIPRNDSDSILIEHNERDKSVFDLFRLNLKDGKLTKAAENDGDVIGWLIDDDGKLRGRYRKLDDHSKVLETQLPGSNKWQKVISWTIDERVDVVGFTEDAKEVWAISNKDTNLIGLVRITLANGKITPVYSEDDVDLDSVFISSVSHKPIVAVSMPGYPRTHFFNAEHKSELKKVKQGLEGYVTILSADNSERQLIVVISSEKSATHYLYNRNTGERQVLGEHHLAKYSSQLASVRPISFQSRDGLKLHGYLTTPKGVSGRQLPMVLKVHGGPLARDYYGLNITNQFLANRGYAVLQVNYRGSTGYGKEFVEAAMGEWGGKMHTDLLDGVNWAIDKGIADKNKICITGGSYGGYAALVGMTFTPGVFACGVDVVGPSNLVTLLRSAPVYWKNYMSYLYKFVGDPEDPEQRKDMEARSPLFKVAAVQDPLLIVQGANDPRVLQRESDQIVKALRDAGKEVDYLLFEDEGHGIQNWVNDMTYHRHMEDFLAKHLGGRSAGFDYYELGKLIF